MANIISSITGTETTGFTAFVAIDGLTVINYLAPTLESAVNAVAATLRDELPKAPAGLTELEARVLAALRQQAHECSGGDFAIVEELKVSRWCSRQALGGVLTSLQAKGIIVVNEPLITNEGTRYAAKVTQVSFEV
jgi:hypothetical protein